MMNIRSGAKERKRQTAASLYSRTPTRLLAIFREDSPRVCVNKIRGFDFKCTVPRCAPLDIFSRAFYVNANRSKRASRDVVDRFIAIKNSWKRETRQIVRMIIGSFTNGSRRFHRDLPIASDRTVSDVIFLDGSATARSYSPGRSRITCFLHKKKKKGQRGCS